MVYVDMPLPCTRLTAVILPMHVDTICIGTPLLSCIRFSSGCLPVQVRECATALLHVAKQHTIPIFLVGHVTKSGDIAGPKILEHIVDAVLYMEGEKHQSFRYELQLSCCEA